MSASDAPRPDRAAPPEPRLHPLVELTKARLREFFREPGMLFWVFGFPILLAVGLGLAFRERPPDRPRIAVLAEARGPLVEALSKTSELSMERLPEAAAARELARTKVALIVDLRSPEPSYRYDPARPDARLARELVDRELQRAAGRRDLLAPRDETESAPGTRYIDFLLPGLLAMNLMGSSVWSIGYGLVIARKRKMLRRLAVTPLRRTHLLLSYFLARAVFLVLEVGVLVAFGALAFGTLIRGSLLGFVLVAFAGAAAFAGIGLMVGARVENTETAQGWLNFIQLPMWILSGTFFSTERFPDWLSPLIAALPLTALTDGLRRIYNEGAGTTDVWAQLAVLSAWMVLGFGFAARRFRWQ